MSLAAEWDQKIQAVRDDVDRLRRAIAQRVIGQDEAIESILAALIVGGHVLLEGLPGTGKTLLARALADAIDLRFQRIQATADLLPADVIGTYVVMETPQGRRSFEFQRGPIFANLVLADHINRAPPKAQSALLQAMDEASITVATESFPLPRPYLILATQNPLESEGAYPLPDAQLDRFLFKIILPPPDRSQLEAIVDRMADAEPVLSRKVLDGERILAAGEVARRMPVPTAVRHWAVSIVAATQAPSEGATPLVRQFVRYGCGPRGAQSLVLAAKARALMAGRSEATRDDVRTAVLPALRHRLILNYDAAAEAISPDAILDEILQTIGPP